MPWIVNNLGEVWFAPYSEALAGWGGLAVPEFETAKNNDEQAGHRLSTGAMEAVVADHPDVAECAVIGVADDIKGQIPLALLVLKAGVTRTESAVTSEVVEMVRREIGPVAAFKAAVVVARLPKTRSGKILRRTLRSIADGAEWQMPATIDDPQILEEIILDFARVGYPPT